MKIARKTSPGDLAEMVARTVREQIAAGQLVPGECVLSERALSARLKVSRGTVRRGLERLVKDGLLRSEPGKGYSLRSPGETDGGVAERRTVVFVHCHSEEQLLEGGRHARIWAGAREEAARSGLLTMISSIPEEELTLARARALADVAGGVLCDHSRLESIRGLQAAGVPVVRLDYPRQRDLQVDAVVQDDTGGIELAVHHLRERGHRSIGYLDTTEFYRKSGRHLNASRRLAGFRNACAELGADVEGVVESINGSAAGAVGVLLEKGVTALVIPHNDLWHEAREALRAAGRDVPGDFGVVVWAGDQVAEDGLVPTYVTWDNEQMGREAVRRLRLRMSRQSVEAVTVVIPARLVDSGTGGRGPAA